MDCDKELIQFVEQNKAYNMVRKTRSDTNVWYKWCAKNGEVRRMEDMPTIELNSLLSHFVMKIWKKDGSEYEPNTITSFFRSFDRYLKDKGQQQRLLFDCEFATSRQVIEAKGKELRKQGLERKEKAAEPISVKEEDL